MNPSRDPTRFATQFFALMMAYCLMFAQLVARDIEWQAGMTGAAVAYGYAAVHLVIARWAARDG